MFLVVSEPWSSRWWLKVCALLVSWRSALQGAVTLCFDQGDDPYEILGVSREATPFEIKRAYRKLALRFHPDRTDDANAASLFNKVPNIHEILSMTVGCSMIFVSDAGQWLR